MPLLQAIPPPQSVPALGGFDYVAVDAARRRVYAAHTGSQSLAIVDADDGRVLGQVRLGPTHGVAVDPANGHVFVGDSEREVSEVDPVAKTVLRSVDLAGPVDAIAYDPGNGRIYADEDDGTHVFVIDAKTMKLVASVALPGHKPEYLAIDPASHLVYQNISDLGEVAVIDPATLRVTRVFRTPQITANHPLQFDAATGHVLVGGKNGTFAAYERDGRFVGSAAIQTRVDQCSLDPATQRLACAGDGKLTILQDRAGAGPVVIATADVSPEAHTVGMDAKTGRAWLVWTSLAGDYVQSFAVSK